MTIPTQSKNVESQRTTLHQRLDTIKELQEQQMQLMQQLKQLRKQRHNAEVKPRVKQIWQDIAASTRLIQSISLLNEMHIHSSTQVSLKTHPYNNFLLWIIIFFNQEHCFLLLFLGRRILKSMIKKMVKTPLMKRRP